MTDNYKDAILFYFGILEAYEVVGNELIGGDYIDEQVVPRMVYYVQNFLPNSFRGLSNIEKKLSSYLRSLKERVTSGEVSGIEDVWQLRAAIFGYESAFLEMLGDNAIKNYVLKRIPEILSFYLPNIFSSEISSLEEKLENYSHFLKESKFVSVANYRMKSGKIEYAVNKCVFAGIHDSDAYLEMKTRFCPWGMMAQAIVNAHFAKDLTLEHTFFTTRWTISTLDIIEEQT